MAKWFKVAGSGAIAGGLIGTSLFASCCVVPLALAGIGFGSSGLAFFAAEYRFPLLIASVAALLVGGAVWLRGPRDGACVSKGQVQRNNRIVGGLIVAGAVLVGFSVGRLDLFGGSAEDDSGVGTRNTVNAGMLRVEMPVTKMSCAPCAAPIRSALTKRFSLRDWVVDIPAQRIAFSVSSDSWSEADALAIVEELGFHAEPPAVTPQGEITAETGRHRKERL